MAYLVVGVGNVYINIGHVMVGADAMIAVMMMTYQMMQYVVCTLIIALNDVAYWLHFCLILQSVYLQVYSTNITSITCSNNLSYSIKALQFAFSSFRISFIKNIRSKKRKFCILQIIFLKK